MNQPAAARRTSSTVVQRPGRRGAQRSALPEDSWTDGMEIGSRHGRFRPKHVWSRKESKYRIRAALLLGVNVLLFACVGCFAFWLRSGEVFAPGIASYFDEISQAFRFGEQSSVSLVTFLIAPINVQDVPMQILIVGLLMAALISIPILVAILYRFWASLPFVAVVGLLAAMPWLAITLFTSCVIAAARPFRTRFRFMSAVLALVPAVVYLVLAWRGGSEILAGEIDPVDRIKFIAPWVLAIVAATLVFAVVLTIAKFVDYRPGAIAPLLAIMLGLPIGLFEFYVGRDELHYRLLSALEKASFSDVDASVAVKQAARRTWERQPLPRRPWHTTLKMEELKWQFYLTSDMGPDRSELTRKQSLIAAKCDWFCTQFPQSRYALSALFIKARTLDQRVDPWEFRRTKWIRFHSDFPSPSSREAWSMLAENGADSTMGTYALLRLAQLDARSGDVRRALDGLQHVLAMLDGASRPNRVDSAAIHDSLPGVLSRNDPEASLTISVERLRLHSRWLLDLLSSNRDPIYGYDPINGTTSTSSSIWFGLLDLDPRHESYKDNLIRLRNQYPNSQIQDNIDLELAKATQSLEHRILKLSECLASYPRRDAAPETLYRLAVAYEESNDSKRSAETFERLRSTYVDSVWSRQATRLMVTAPFAVTRATP